MGDWSESAHPRDSDGKFSSGGGGGLKAWARGTKAPDLEERKRSWTDKLPAGMTPETWQAHYDAHPSEGGKASPERQELHERIIADAFKGVQKPEEGEQKVAIMTMGGPASGKSSMLKGVDSSKFVKVDPDAIKERLPEYRAATRPESTYRGAAAMAHEESSAVAKEVLNRAVAEGHHVIVDGTGANAQSMLKKMDALKAAGYHVHVAYAHVEMADGLKRIEQRAEKTGRYVPEKFAKAAYDSIPKNFPEIGRKADTFAVHDASRPGSPVAWEKTAGGTEMHHDVGFVQRYRAKHGG